MWDSKTWISPGDGEVNINEILTDLPNESLFIGCDSKGFKEKTNFACAIIHERKYYYTKFKGPKFNSIHERLREEVNNIISLANFICETHPNIKVEVHYDISQKPQHLSNKILKYASSYAESMCLKWKAKPNAWASTDIADWHTK